MHIKRSRSVFTRHSLNIVFKPSSVFPVCPARGWVCRERLVIYQSAWITRTPWTEYHSSWKPHVSGSKIKNDITIQKNLVRNKAVLDGAISFYLDHFVRSRDSKITYGFCSNPLYDPSDPDHISRPHNVITSIAGDKQICGYFDIILPKVSCLFPCLKSMYL